ncbi:hypothetical protein KI387_028989, partial [Taxus chinensis]
MDSLLGGFLMSEKPEITGCRLLTELKEDGLDVEGHGEGGVLTWLGQNRVGFRPNLARIGGDQAQLNVARFIGCKTMKLTSFTLSRLLNRELYAEKSLEAIEKLQKKPQKIPQKPQKSPQKSHENPQNKGPYYCELAEKLIGEIKDVFNAMAAAETVTPAVKNIAERLVMVDNIERLGIDRHFKKEITQSLDYVYRYWKELHRDLNMTALGLRILRLHRYEVSSDVLENFKAKNGEFFCSTTQPEEEIKKFLNLFRASLIVFPKENVMEDAKSFATAYLNQALQNTEISSSLSQEVMVLRNSTYFSPRTMPVDKKLLCLAKLDFNIVQSIYQRELKNLSRWWMEFDLSKLTFARHRHVEYHLISCAICVEPKYFAFRKSFAKICVLGTILDDIYDTHGTIDELKLFTTAIKRNFMFHYYIIFIMFYWEVYIDALMQEAEWLHLGYIPTLNEYLENGKVSSGVRNAILPSILTLDGLLPENILHKIDYPSRFDELSGLMLRLKGDTRTFKAEANRGEEASCITSFMRDHPGSSEEVALNYIK